MLQHTFDRAETLIPAERLLGGRGKGLPFSRRGSPPDSQGRATQWSYTRG